MAFSKTLSEFKDSGELSAVVQDKTDHGNIQATLRDDQNIKVQVSTKGTVTVFYPSEYGILFWYKLWHSKLIHVLCSDDGKSINVESEKTQSIGNRDLQTPMEGLAAHIYALEQLGELPMDHVLLPAKPSKEIVQYYGKFFKAASDWESTFPPTV